jgi:hypothetical protein
MSLPSSLQLSSNKPLASAGVPNIQRFNADNSVYKNNNIIKIEIPTGGQGDYIFPRDSYIEGQLHVNYTSDNATNQIFLDGNVFSLFHRMRIVQGGNTIEDLMYCNHIWNSIYDIQVNAPRRQNDAINMLVDDTDGLLGRNFLTTTTGTATESSTYDFSFTLPSAILGSLATKALPTGLMGASSIYLELELDSATTAFYSKGGTVSINSFTVENVYFNAKSVKLPSEINNLIIQSTGGSINLPAVAYKAESKSISTGSTAFNDKFAFNYSSLKNFCFFLHNTASIVDSTKRSITSRPRAYVNDYFILLNGTAFPSQTIASPSRQFAELQRAYDTSSADPQFGGILNFSNYTRDLATTVDDVASNPEKRWIGGINLDRFSSGSDSVLMSGSSSIGQQVNLQLNFNTNTNVLTSLNGQAGIPSLTQPLTIFAFCMHDVVYNLQNGLLSAKV